MTDDRAPEPAGRAGDSQAMTRREFAAQYRRNYRRLWLVAAGSVGDRTEADDIVQDAATVAFRKLRDFHPGSSFSAWLAEIVRRCASNHVRKRTGRRTFATDPSSLDQEGQRPSRSASMDTTGGLAVLSFEFDDDMLRALNRLSPDARICLLLRVVDGLSYEEIANFVGIPAGTAMSHVHRSKQSIRRQLGASRPSGKAVDE